MSNLPGSTWEGSAWTPGQEIPRDSQLRYALLAPRLVAPHANAATNEVSAPQAIALVVALRISDIQLRYKEKQPLLDEKLSSESNDFEWKLFAALYGWTSSGKRDPLLTLASESVAPEARAAAVAVAAAALFEDGEMRAAIRLLKRALSEHDDYNPVDYAWLRLHLATNLVQVGSFRRARRIALEVAMIGQVAASDPTSRFLAGIAADMLFSLSGWQGAELEAMIKARDNAASWWRSQTMTSGLSAYMESTFKTWANDPSTTVGGQNEVWVRLRSAMLTSVFAGDTSAWRQEASLLGQYILMLERSPAAIASALDLLRISGATEELGLAVNRALERGPIDVLVEVAEKIQLKRATRDSLQSDLELLGQSGSVLPAHAADQTARWLLAELVEPSKRAKALKLRFRYTDLLVLTLARVYIACSPVVQHEIRNSVCALPTIEAQSIAHNYAALLKNIDDADWSPEQLQALNARADGDNFELREALDTVVANRDHEFRASLVDRITQGDMRALGSWGNVRDLPGEAAAGITRHIAGLVRSDVESSRGGVYWFGSGNALHTLVLMNVWHPRSADWDACIEALSEERSGPNDLIQGIRLMVLLARRIPDDVRERLREPLQRLASEVPSPAFGAPVFGISDLRGDAALLFASLFPEEAPPSYILGLLRGTSEQVVAAIRLIAPRRDVNDLSALATLSVSDDTRVRAAVAATLSEWVALGVGGDDARELLECLLAEPGVRLATHVTRALADLPRSAHAEALTEALAGHPSAVVRYHVRVLRRQWDAHEEEAGRDR